MWWRILTFCLLVTLILFVVLSCIHGRPVINLFFHRCCEDDIENDQVLFENFGNEYLKERLVSSIDDGIFNLTDDSIQIEKKINVHDPGNRIRLELMEIEEEVNGTKIDEEDFGVSKDGLEIEGSRRKYDPGSKSDNDTDQLENNDILMFRSKISKKVESSEVTTIGIEKLNDDDSSESVESFIEISDEKLKVM